MLGEKSSGASPKCSYLAPNSSLLLWILNNSRDGRLASRLKKMFIKITPRKNCFMILFLSELKLVLVLQLWRQYDSLPPSLPPRTNRKHSRPDHARAIKVEINIANTTFTAPRILARSCLSWNWFFVFKPKLVASSVAGLVAWLPGLARQNLNEKRINLTTLCTFEWWEVRGLEKTDLEISLTCL